MYSINNILQPFAGLASEKMEIPKPNTWYLTTAHRSVQIDFIVTNKYI